MRTITLLGFVFLVSVALPAQNVKVDAISHTISVVATGSAKTEADTAIISVVCSNYGSTSEAAYEENARIGNQLLTALEKAGVSKSSIATNAAEVNPIVVDRDWTAEQKLERRYRAEHQLTVTIATDNASSLVDLAMHSGASELKQVTWDLSDDSIVNAKAMDAAFNSARTLAEQLAKSSGRKLGAIISISNEGQEFDREARFTSANLRIPTKPGGESISLRPEKITRNANVQVVFQME